MIPLDSDRLPNDDAVPATGTRVLIVDDDPDDILLARYELDESGRFSVCGTARDGEDALRQIETLRPDLVLLDLNMPRADGWHVLSALQRGRHNPFVVLHTHDDAPDLEARATEVGAAGLIRKGFQPTLSTDLVRLLEHRRARSGAVSS